VLIGELKGWYVLRIILSVVFVLMMSGLVFAGYNSGLVCSDPPDFNPDNGNNRSFAECWQLIRSQWGNYIQCSKGPIRHHKNSAGNAYEFWFCISYGQWCEESGWSPRYITKALNCGSGVRNYTGQHFVGNLNEFVGVSSDANLYGLTYDQQECESVMMQFVSCPEGSVAWYVDMTDNSMYYVETGVNDCVPFPQQWLEGVEYEQTTTQTPTPTPSVMPSPTPTPSIVPTFTPTGTPISTPVPSPVVTPTPYRYPQPIYNPTVVPVPTSDGEVLNTNIDDIEYDTSVPDVGQDLQEDDTWLDNIFDMFTNHPVIDVINNSKITTSGELCKLSINLYSKTIEISFCDLTDYVEIFGYFVVVCASIYAYFIIFKVS